MAKKYTYSREIETKEGFETFSAVEFDSFDEAITAVDKGINDRIVTLRSRQSPPPIVNQKEVSKSSTSEVKDDVGYPTSSFSPNGSDLGGENDEKINGNS